MRFKSLTFLICLLLLMPKGLTLSVADPFGNLDWQRVAGDQIAEKGYPDGNGNIPEGYLDIVGDSDNAPARFALDDDYVYFELRVAGKVNAEAHNSLWMALFYPAGTDADPRGNFNNAVLQAGLRIDKSGNKHFYEVVVINVSSPGHKRTLKASYRSAEFYNFAIDNGCQLVRWKIPLAQLEGYSHFTLATGNSNNDVPNRDWYGWNTFPTPAPNLYKLTLEANPPEGCTSLAGAGEYAAGTPVTVNATANEGYLFANWTEDGQEVSNQPGFTYTMSGDDVTLTANFVEQEPEEYQLTLKTEPDDGGTVSGGGSYIHGELVTVSATASEGYEFVNWTEGENIVSSQSSFTYTMPGKDVTMTANFREIVYTLTLVADPTEGGTFDGEGTYAEGENIQVSAAVSPGYEFVSWTNGESIVSTQSSFTYTMPGNDVTLTANFQEVESPPENYTLTLVANPAGAGILQGGGSYVEGEEVLVSAAATEGYEFVNWTENGQEVSVQSCFTYTMPGNNATLTANFQEVESPPEKYTLVLIASPAAGGILGGSGSYVEGEEVPVSATASAGYVFVNWVKDGQVVSGRSSFTYTMPGNNATLTANFRKVVYPPEMYTLTLIANPTGAGTLKGSGSYVKGEEVPVSATASEGYEFVNWMVGGSVVSSTNTFTFVMPAENTTLVANYTRTLEPDLDPGPPDPGPKPDPERDPKLPVTGTNIDWLVPLGFALIAAGSVAARKFKEE